jgi:iron complex outermembrane receptor protein
MVALSASGVRTAIANLRHLTAITLSVTLLSGVTQAQEEESVRDTEKSSASDDVPPGVEVLHVRGRGVEAIDTEVAASVTQFDASTIQALGAQNIADLSRVTPNVNIVQPGATQATFFVRGIGLSDFSSNAAGAVTILQDGVALNAPALQTGSLYDIESVDVVRGPQGTGAYRNSSAGAIVVRSRRPTGNYGATLHSAIGRYDTIGSKGAAGAMFQDHEGALEMPIVADLLSSRFAFRLRDGEPYKTNGCANNIPFDQRPLVFHPTFAPNGVSVADAAICNERDSQPFNPGNGMIPQGRTSQIPFGLDRRVGDQHNWAARGTFRLQPPDTDIDLTLSGHGSRVDQDSALGQAVGLLAPGIGDIGSSFGGAVTGNYQEPDQRQELTELCGPLTPQGACSNAYASAQFRKKLASGRPLDRKPYRGDYNRVGEEQRDTWGGVLFGDTSFDLGDMQLSVLASYDGYSRSRDQDADFTPDVLFESREEDEAWQTYEEIELSGEIAAEPLRWEIGGYYLHETLDVVSNSELRGGNTFDREYSQRIDSLASWVAFEWDFLDDFTLAGGVRFNWEDKKFRYALQQTVQLAEFPPKFASDRNIWQTPTGELTLTYHATRESSLYAKYSRGFKAGHFNALASQEIVLTADPADEEYNDAWEMGLNGSWLSNRLTVRSAFFYYRYENYQVFLFRDRTNLPPALEILNAKEAENYGAELELQLRPLRGWAPRLVEGLAVSANFGWLHGEFLDFQSEIERPGGQVGLRIPVDFSGNDLQNSPEYKVSGTAEWTLDLGRWGYLIPRYDLIWTDDVFFDATEGRGSGDLKGYQPGAIPPYAVGQKQFFLHNVRLAYRTPTSNVELAFFVRNLTDEVYKNFVFDAAAVSSVFINFVGEPRTYGVDVTLSFF